MQWDIVIIFFVYGLAFFSMGIALLLETTRSPRLAERRVLWPLAVFGLLHGTHEWIEIFLLQGVWLGVPFPEQFNWARYALLVLSFMPLVYFGLLMIMGSGHAIELPIAILVGMLSIYAILLFSIHRLHPELLFLPADTLARYVLAVPGGILAGWGLRKFAQQVEKENRGKLARRFNWAALGFLFYGLTQIFVGPIDLFPANVINSAVFTEVVGFPVQLVRATMAALVTVNLIQAIQVVDREREEQLLSVQQERLAALEQVQRDLEEREVMRRELLRHTVIAQEDERGRISRELHDETAQFLTALSLNLATLENLIPQQQRASELIDDMQSQTRQMSQGIYRLVHDLRPAQLDDLGLVPALQYLAEEEYRRAELKVELNIEGQHHRLDPLVETVFFRVAQEALTNVVRHAQCDQAHVDLVFESDQVVLRVRDEGVGFKPRASDSQQQGWGLEGMRERVESVEGRLKIFSPESGGTIVQVIIPVDGAKTSTSEEVLDGHNSPDVS